MAPNSTSYDLVADLLSTNNTINVAALVGSFSFGVLAVYGCFLTWRHQQWERQLKDGGVIGAENALEAGIHSEPYQTQDRNTHLNDQTALEEHSDGRIFGGVSSSQSAASTLAAEEDIHEPTGLDDIDGLVVTGDGDGQEHMKDRQDASQRPENMPAVNLGPHSENGTPTPSHTTSGQVDYFTHADHDGIAIDKSGSVAKAAA